MLCCLNHSCTQHIWHKWSHLLGSPCTGPLSPPGNSWLSLQHQWVKVKLLQILCRDWLRHGTIRHLALKNGQLLKWPNKKQIGVISFETIAFNARVLDHLLRFHCPSVKTPKTVNIDLLREEVRGTKVKTTWFF